MSSWEFERWRQLESIDPFGQRREDYRFAKLALELANALGAKHRNNRELTLDDFLPPWPITHNASIVARPLQAQSQEEIETWIMLMVAANNKAFAEKGQLQ